jgi:hypothetical protein
VSVLFSPLEIWYRYAIYYLWGTGIPTGTGTW